ncbi:MAG: 2-amino-3,7-dideoxy-D-threo-hept-6-ulosonate synthase [Candidatus Bathyarchaeia archaeon]
MGIIGKKIRLSRIFKKDGKVLICAMDHGSFAGPMKGIENPKETMRKVIEGGVDAFLLTPGLVKNFYEEIAGKASFILRIDGGQTIYSKKRGPPTLVSSVEEAIRLGADGVVTISFIGIEDEREEFRILGEVAEKCNEYGMPLLAEILPEPNEKIKNRYDAEAIKVAARVGAELGADFIKTNYTGDPKTFKEVVKSCPVPIVIAGGPKLDSDMQVLSVVKGAMESGAAGIAFGRNIWQHENLTALVKALSKIIHEEASIEEAIKVLHG